MIIGACFDIAHKYIPPERLYVVYSCPFVAFEYTGKSKYMQRNNQCRIGMTLGLHARDLELQIWLLCQLLGKIYFMRQVKGLSR